MTEPKKRCRDAFARVVINGRRELLLVRPDDDEPGRWTILLPWPSGTLTEVIAIEPLFPEIPEKAEHP